MAVQYITPATHTEPVTVNSGSVAIISRSTFRNQLRTDLAEVFYSEEEFAEEITWRYAGGSSQTIPAIFDEEHMATDIETGAPAIVSEPQIHVPTHLFTDRAGKGDSVRIRGRDFEVKEVLPDGTGVCVVTLLRE